MIELHYFEDCPNAKKTIDNLLELKNELAIKDDEVRMVKIPDIRSAEIHRFQGSPTILIDGVDIYTGSRPVDFSFSCRIYSFEGVQTGVIPKDYMKKKIAAYRQ